MRAAKLLNFILFRKGFREDLEIEVEHRNQVASISEILTLIARLSALQLSIFISFLITTFAIYIIG